METAQNIECPFCGQSFDLVIDTSIEISLPIAKFVADHWKCTWKVSLAQLSDCKSAEKFS
jgi:hypothetical protein